MLSRFAHLIILGAVVTFALPARADVAPWPPRPSDQPRPAWGEHPPPQPDLPPEKDLDRLALALAALVLAGVASWRLRLGRTEVRS